ncbi:hypothetical protein B6I21_04970 [candidate division KSB1 bacterium 4572_119]|nr:MAG: hypothetical protein B6I21_04970 [candidate division KSB1 bacterium 4572_119]
MQTDYSTINDSYEMTVTLLSISYLYGDYAIPYHFMNSNSQVYLSAQKGDIIALQKFASRNWIDFDVLSDKQKQEIKENYEKIKNKYGDKLKNKPAPLPLEFLNDLGERAMSLGRYMDAHSAFKDSGELEKKANQLIVEAIHILESKEINDSDSPLEILETKIAKTVELVFQAVKLKNPFSGQYQKLGTDLHYEDAESLRKFKKYIDQSLFKEIIEFCIQFLLDDKNIYGKISPALSSGKIRRLFLKTLAIKLSAGKENFQTFVNNYQHAVKNLQAAKSEQDFLEVQKTLLGRFTGKNHYIQYLRELSLEHPISVLLVSTETTPENQHYIAPLILKSGISLLDFLELSS